VYQGTASGFEDISSASRMGPNSRPYAGWGVVFADLDNDGRLDIAAAASDALSGKVDPARVGPVVWFRNGGGGRFDPAQTLAVPAMHRGLVAADLDQDGCLDLVVTALDAAPKILRNPCTNLKGSRAPRQWLGSTAVGYASSVWDESFFAIFAAAALSLAQDISQKVGQAMRAWPLRRGRAPFPDARPAGPEERSLACQPRALRCIHKQSTANPWSRSSGA
jgi:hypothetical protein